MVVAALSVGGYFWSKQKAMQDAEQAAKDAMAGYVDNTLLSMNQPHYIFRTWYYANGNFRQFKVGHDTGMLLLSGWEGKWHVQASDAGFQVCKDYNPIPVPTAEAPPQPGCIPLEPHKVNDIWRVTYKD